MQNKNGKTLEYLALPKRSRYYQLVMDSEILKKRVNYSRLNDSYIIFICTFDEKWWGEYMKSVTWEMDARYEGVLDTLIALVKDGIIDITEAAKRANISEDEFMTMIENI